jgi:hypothetical protein
MADDYIEILLKWTPQAATDVARRWLEQRGLTIMPMRDGALLTGTRAQVERALSVSLAGIEPPAKLAIPPELQEHVKSISFPKPRSYHS